MLFSTTVFVQDLAEHDTMTLKNYMLFSMCSITYSSQDVILLSLATSIVGSGYGVGDLSQLTFKVLSELPLHNSLLSADHAI